MNNKESEESFFSRQFREIYEHLGLFAFLYFTKEDPCIQKQEFIRQAKKYQADTETNIRDLKKYNLISEQQGILRLHTDFFFKITLWDLLIHIKSWIGKSAANAQDGIHTPHQPQSYEEIKAFAQNFSLSESYMSMTC